MAHPIDPNQHALDVLQNISAVQAAALIQALQQVANENQHYQTTAGASDAAEHAYYLAHFANQTTGAGGGAPRRPVNCWMGFRQYYNGSLGQYTQMDRSRILKDFWRADPFREKWQMLVDAYNVLRGNLSKTQAPLGEFLTRFAPAVGIIPADQYQYILGWTVRTTAQGQFAGTERIQEPDFTMLPEEYTFMSCTTQELIEYAHSEGFPNLAGQNVQSLDQGPASMNMASGNVMLRTIFEQPPQGPAVFRPGNAGRLTFNPNEVDSDAPDNGVWNGYNIQPGLMGSYA